MSKKQDVASVTKRVQMAFGTKAIEVTGEEDLDLRNLVAQMIEASADAWIIKLMMSQGFIKNKTLPGRYFQFMEDIIWVNERVDIVRKFINPMNITVYDSNSYLSDLQVLNRWEGYYIDLLENDMGYSALCGKRLMDLVVNRLTNLVYMGKDRIFETRYFVPMALIKVVEGFITIIQTNGSKDNQENLVRLNRMLKHLKNM